MYRIALLSDAPRAQELIPALSLLSHRVIELPLDSPLSTIGTEHDIVILDARQNLLKARNTAQLLKTAGITIPLMIVLTEGGMAAVSASWQVDDIVRLRPPKWMRACACWLRRPSSKIRMIAASRLSASAIWSLMHKPIRRI